MKIGDKVTIKGWIINSLNMTIIPGGTICEITQLCNGTNFSKIKTIEGDYNFEGYVGHQHFEPLTNNNTMTNTVNLETVVFDLIAKNGSTSTLEVRDELRMLNPTGVYFQTDISNDMNQMFVDGKLSWTFNGTYRIYTLPVAPTKSVVSKECTRTELADIMESYEGSDDEVTITYTNKEGGVSEKTGFVDKFDSLGYRHFILEDKTIRIDLRRISKITCGNNVWTLKSK